MRKAQGSQGRCRARELGIVIGEYKTGRHNAITDVPGVLVGHATVHHDRGPARTGVTAILPNSGNIYQSRVVGSGFVLNGAGEVSGLTQVMEWGLIETPILLTNTLSVGKVSEATVKYMVGRYPGIGQEEDVVIPVVGECDDSWLNDIAGQHINDEHVYEAIRTASSGPVAEGSVGGGTGMITCDFKSGIGTSSRRLPESEGGYVLGVLVMSNFGYMRDLRIYGLGVGRLLEPHFRDYQLRRRNYGSIIAVVATNAPLLPHQVSRLSKRVALGIGKAGSSANHGSGEIIVGFSTANAVPRVTRKMVARVKFLLDHRLDPLYRAAIEATEEAILNSLCKAEEMVGQQGRRSPALPLDRVRALFSERSKLLDERLNSYPPAPRSRRPGESLPPPRLRRR